jgi:hypothetical protein
MVPQKPGIRTVSTMEGMREGRCLRASCPSRTACSPPLKMLAFRDPAHILSCSLDQTQARVPEGRQDGLKVRDARAGEPAPSLGALRVYSGPPCRYTTSLSPSRRSRERVVAPS